MSLIFIILALSFNLHVRHPFNATLPGKMSLIVLTLGVDAVVFLTNGYVERINNIVEKLWQDKFA